MIEVAAITATASVIPMLVALCLGFVTFRKGRKLTAIIVTVLLIACWAVVWWGWSQGTYDSYESGLALLAAAVSLIPGVILCVAALTIARPDSSWALENYSEDKRTRAERNSTLRDPKSIAAIILGIASGFLTCWFLLWCALGSVSMPGFLVVWGIVLGVSWGTTIWLWRSHKSRAPAYPV